MKVFKFGGASVKDVHGVKNVAVILQSYAGTPVLVVVSAMGKTTNALERILNRFWNGNDYAAELTALKQFHASITDGLFPPQHPVFLRIGDLFSELEKRLRNTGNYDEVY